VCRDSARAELRVEQSLPPARPVRLVFRPARTPHRRRRDRPAPGPLTSLPDPATLEPSLHALTGRRSPLPYLPSFPPGALLPPPGPFDPPGRDSFLQTAQDTARAEGSSARAQELVKIPASQPPPLYYAHRTGLLYWAQIIETLFPRGARTQHSYRSEP